MNRIEARTAVEAWLVEEYPRVDVLVDDRHTMERPWGWVFQYNTRSWVLHRQHEMVGCGPLAVLNDGTVHPLSTAESLEDGVARFERSRGLVPHSA